MNNIKAAENLQLGTLSHCREGGASGESISREMMCSIIDNMVPMPANKVAVIGHRADLAMTRHEVLIYDTSNNTWKVQCHWTMPPGGDREDTDFIFVQRTHDILMAIGNHMSFGINIAKMVTSDEQYPVQAERYRHRNPKFHIGDHHDSMVATPDDRMFFFGLHDGVYKYYPKTLSWVKDSGSGRSEMCRGAACIALDNDHILITGYIGMDNMLGFRKKCTIYRLSCRRFLRTGDMNLWRKNHAACLMPNGEVFVCGGLERGVDSVGECEVYNPKTKTWRTLGGKLIKRDKHSCMAISPTLVLIVGGCDLVNNTMATDECEIYDLQTESAVRVSNIPRLCFRPVMMQLYE